MTPRIFLSSIFALTLFINGHSPAFSAHKVKRIPGISPYVQIPVLYMTDRAYANNMFINQRKLEEGSIYDLYAGTAEYTIENVDHKTLTEAQKKLGWHYVDKLPKNPLVQTQFSESGKKHIYAQLGQAIIETAKKTGNDEFFVNAHGFNNPFAGAVNSAVKLAYAVERPVLLYSWPSAARIALYDVDSTNNEWSQEHYNRLMEELMCVKKKSDIKFFLVAHSMGNRLAIRAAALLKGKNLFDQCFLVDPDLDAETFMHYIARYAVSGVEEKELMAKTDSSTVSPGASNVPNNAPGKLRILFSHHDNALPIVQLLFSGGYTRLGQGADNMLAAMFDPNAFSNFMQGAAEFFQPDTQIDAKSDPATQDSDKNAKNEPSPEYLTLAKRFQWIDYTVLDHGMLGHTVPFNLIASLWSTGTPGAGLKFIMADNGSVNRFTRFTARIFRQTKHFGDIGRCEKVVYEKNIQGKLVSTAH